MAAGRGWDGLVQSNRSRNWNIGQVRFWRPDIEVCSTSTTKGYGNFKLVDVPPASLSHWQLGKFKFKSSPSLTAARPVTRPCFKLPAELSRRAGPAGPITAPGAGAVCPGRRVLARHGWLV